MSLLLQSCFVNRSPRWHAPSQLRGGLYSFFALHGWAGLLFVAGLVALSQNESDSGQIPESTTPMTTLLPR